MHPDVEATPDHETAVDAESFARAILNILDDAAEKSSDLASTQRAIYQKVEEFNNERHRVEEANAALRDEIAERVRVEEQLRRANAQTEAANRELERFAYTVSHDLRAPLRSMAGFCQALVEDYGDALDETGKDYVRRVSAASQRMGRLIDDLLALSRVARTEVRRTDLDLSGMAEAIACRLDDAEPDRTVTCRIQPGLSAHGDEVLLNTVLENLLGNAWKYSRGQPQARIEFGVEEDGAEPVFYVRDNGTGFDMAHAAKLFQPFQRLHRETEFEGTGIGLASVANIVQRHGGRIWAESAPGIGTTMRFTL